MNKSILWALILAAAFVAISAGLRYAAKIDMISDETVKRAIQVLIGLGLAVYSNFTPKQIGAPASPRIEAWRHKLLRVSGWSMVLAGLAYAGLWALAPLPVANLWSVVAVVTAMLVTIGYFIRFVIACRTVTAG